MTPSGSAFADAPAAEASSPESAALPTEIESLSPWLGQLDELICAATPAIWIETIEPSDAAQNIESLARTRGYALRHWDLERGLRESLLSDPPTSEEPASLAAAAPGGDPLTAIRALTGLPSAEPLLLVCWGLHRLLESPELIAAISAQLPRAKQQHRHLIVLSPGVRIPLELSRDFVSLEHPLPERDELATIARSLAVEPGEMPEGEDLERVLDAARGLTRQQAEAALSLSLIREGVLKPASLWQQKRQLLRQEGLLVLEPPAPGFGALGGLGALKAFCRQCLVQRRSPSQPSASPPNSARPDPARPEPTRPDPTRHRARGVLLLGVPGTGKSAFARSLGTETGRPVLSMSIGGLMGGIVGQTEQNVRRALTLAEAMSPCVLFVDEVEKGLAGAAGTGAGDGGVATRLFGTVLSWLSDHTSDVFVVCTCNDISKLPPEFSRAERFDAVVFLDLPERQEKDAIWQLYRREFDIAPDQSRPEDEQWTGAEIRACCRLAHLLGIGLVDAARYVVPVAVTARDSVRRLQVWASGRCVDAQRGGLYQAPGRRRSSQEASPSETAEWPESLN